MIVCRKQMFFEIINKMKYSAQNEEDLDALLELSERKEHVKKHAYKKSYTHRAFIMKLKKFLSSYKNLQRYKWRNIQRNLLWNRKNWRHEWNLRAKNRADRKESMLLLQRFWTRKSRKRVMIKMLIKRR